MNLLNRKIILLLAGATFAFNASAAPVKIRLGTLAPNGSSYYKHLQTMGEKWKKASGGNVTLTIYPDGTMGGEADMVRRMKLGQLQAGMVTATGLSEIEPGVAGLQSMPMVFRSLEEVDFIGEKLQPIFEKRLAEKGFVVLFWSDTGWVRFFSKQPIVTPADLKKTKLFVAANRPAEENVYRSAGCNPVPLEVTDILPNLQTGLINAVSLPPSIALALQVDNAAPNMLDLNWVPLVGAAIVTKKTWDAIPAASQAALRQAAIEAGKSIKADGRREGTESVAAMQKRGLKVHPVTPETEAQWKQIAESVYSKIRGVTVPAEIFDEVLSQLKTFRASRETKK
ncbi:MAG: TRAP transporter substrate-binding protein DctP [Verrucomicrobiota bacterium]